MRALALEDGLLFRKDIGGLEKRGAERDEMLDFCGSEEVFEVDDQGRVGHDASCVPWLLAGELIVGWSLPKKLEQQVWVVVVGPHQHLSRAKTHQDTDWSYEIVPEYR